MPLLTSHLYPRGTDVFTRLPKSGVPKFFLQRQQGLVKEQDASGVGYTGSQSPDGVDVVRGSAERRAQRCPAALEIWPIRSRLLFSHSGRGKLLFPH